MANKDLYNIFLQDRPFLPIYIQSWYLDLVCGMDHWNACVVSREGRPIAVLPYCLKRNRIFTWIGMPAFSKLHGPYIDLKYDDSRHHHSIVKELLAQLPKVSFYQQALPYRFANWLPYLWAGYSQVTLYSYIFRKIDVEQILKNMDSDCRRRIKRSDQVLHFDSDLTIGDFYEIIRITYARQGLPAPVGFDFIDQYYHQLFSRSAGQIFCVRNESKRILAVAMLVWDKESAYYLLEGTDHTAGNKDAAIYLKWRCICYVSESLKIGRFDFEGSISERIEKVYREFGAEAVPYYVIKRYYSKIFLAVKFMQNFRQYGKLVQW